MPRRCSIGSLSVPMSKPRYTAVESQLMISPWQRSAIARLRALLPEAVGPSTARTRGRTFESNHESGRMRRMVPTESVGDQRFHPLDHDILERSSLRFELESELLLQGGEERRAIVRRTGRHRWIPRQVREGFRGPPQREVVGAREARAIDNRTAEPRVQRLRKVTDRPLAAGNHPSAAIVGGGESATLGIGPRAATP